MQTKKRQYRLLTKAIAMATVALAFAGFTAGFMLTPTVAQAKDLSNRLGIGYANQFSTNIPSLAVRYYPNSKLALGAELGVDTEQNNSNFGFQVNVHRIIFTEENLNFYMGSAGGLISTQSNGSSTQSGFELSAIVGCEFFFTGLENLAFSFEAGMGVDSISSQVRVRTIGDSPLQAGILFYF